MDIEFREDVVVGMPSELAAVPVEQMEQAYFEFRKACYWIVYRSLYDVGGLKLLDTPRTSAEFARELGVPAGREATVELLLEAMTRFGAVRRAPGDPARFVAESADLIRVPFDEDLLLLSTGRRNVRELRDWMNYALIVPTLLGDADEIGIAFDESNLPLWIEALETPYFKYPRLRAVEALSRLGPRPRLLDLACGLGHGLLELAERVGTAPDARFVGIEISSDFVAYARKTISDPRITVLEGDVESMPEGFEPASFDGAMITGAYHFLSRPESLWKHMARAIRPGGLFYLAYVRTRNGKYDEELMNLRYALRDSESTVHRPDDIIATAASHGFELLENWSMGIWGSFCFTHR